MRKDREIPDQWLRARLTDSGDERSSTSEDARSLGSMASSPASALSHNRLSRTNSAVSKRDRRGRNYPPDPERQGWLRFLTSWKLWALFTFVLTGGLGGTALMALLRLPAVPNCGAGVWNPTASEHLYCAQKAASSNTVEGLLAAINEVHQLPQDHPLRSEIDRQIERWAEQLLELAEKVFQEGKLSKAIATARQIPSDTSAAGLVQERIDRWQSIWKEAEQINQNAESEIEKENWSQAFRELRKLLAVGNTYWETTRYDALNQIIEATQKEGETLDKARSLASAGELKQLLDAIALVEKIDPKSKLYKKSRSLINDFSKQILELAEKNVEKKDWQEAIYVARQVPANSSVKEEAEDFIDIARAQSIAARATVSSLEDAISKLQQIGPDRPLHLRAKQLIIEWQDSITDVAYLERARSLAQGGSVRDLRAAIAQAQLVGRYNPVWDETQEEIDRWQSRIEVTEDQPYLKQAEQLASYGDRASLEAAINTALKIAPGRALYDDAQGKIGEWNQEIERIQDRPILDRAWNLAQWGNLQEAVAVAQTIPPNRALYEEAQSAIESWRTESRDRQRLDEAYQIGDRAQTPQELVRAMSVANQVSSSSSLRYSADAAIQDWSQRILIEAQQQSTYNLMEAIAIAKQVPYYSGLYAQARREIEAWELLVNPPQLRTEPETAIGTTPTTPAVVDETPRNFDNSPAAQRETPRNSGNARAQTEETPRNAATSNPAPESIPVDPIDGVNGDRVDL